MKRAISYFILLLCSFLALLIVIFWNKHYRNNLSIKQLPDIELMTLDSTYVHIQEIVNDTMPIVILYFHPECELCRMELVEMLKTKEVLENFQLLLVSIATTDEIKEFIDIHPIADFRHVKILHDNKGIFSKTFNIQTSPVFYIYDKRKKLKKVLKGTTSIDNIKQYMK